MSGPIARFKPAAPRGTHLFLAATMWTLVGAGLSIAGLRWLAAVERIEWRVPLVVLALGIGAFKAVFALRPAARRIAIRIEARGDGRCLGGFFSWRTWIFVACMIGLGRGLRFVGTPWSILGVLYLAVGAALLAASWWLWTAWGRHRARARRPA
ncbi:MAG: hypothetical protein ACYTG1_02820 [Planctomycetota bacterium]